MIYFTAFIFIFTLLAHIARPVPACGDVASPEELFDTYDDDSEQLVLATYKVTEAKYDNPDGNTNDVVCSDGLAGIYPQFKNFPDFPYLGGAFDTHSGSSNCGKCWRLSNHQASRAIYFTAIDSAGGGFNMGKKAFIALNGDGTVGNGTLDAEAQSVAGRFCGFK